MNSSSIKGANRAFTLLEVAVVISTLGLMVLLLLPALVKRRSPYTGIYCINNLKQLGLAFRMWSDDNGGLYPMQFRTNNFDGPSYAVQQKMYVYFQAMSNELNTPTIVVCPSDTNRNWATNFSADFNNSKISYFVGLDAVETNPTMFLAGDRNIDNGLPPYNGLLELKTNQPVRWASYLHNGQGNIALADGSVNKYISTGLGPALLHTGTNITRLALP